MGPFLPRREMMAQVGQTGMGVIAWEAGLHNPDPPFRTEGLHFLSFWEGCQISALSGNYPPLERAACPGHGGG